MSDYFGPMDRYEGNGSMYSNEPLYGDSSGRDNYGMIDISRLGTSIIAGKGQGSFRNSLQAAIRQGTASVEMALQPEGGEPGTAAESYGHEARRELREIAMASGVEINSIHAPSQIGNVSGRTQEGYNEQARLQTIDEIGKSVDFAADVGMGGSIVVHTGEFDRSIDEAKWNNEAGVSFGDFEGSEEHGMVSWVDAKTGQVQIIPRTHRFVYVPRDESGHVILDETGKIPQAEIERYSYNDLVKMYNDEPEKFNQRFNNYDRYFGEEGKFLNANSEGENKPLKALFGLHIGQQLADAQSRKAMYVEGLMSAKESLKKIDKAMEFYEKLSPEERQQRNIMQGVGMRYGVSELIPPDAKDPLEALKEARKEAEWNVTSYEDYSISGTLTEKDLLEKAINFRTHKDYALEKSMDSLARLGLRAMEKSNDPNFKKMATRDIYVAPENIFPSMGYGSHPDELIEMVEKSRERMVDLLTKKEIEVINPDDGKVVRKINPHYMGISKEQAAKEAEEHIKATLDFQHLGMWRQHMQRKNGESLQEMEQRFQKWYNEQIDKLVKVNKEKNILGNLHVVDGMGSVHTHLPTGEGNNPIKGALLKLIDSGYKGVMNSDAHEYNTMFGPGEQLHRTWTNLGSPIYSVNAPRTRRNTWDQVQNSYFGQTNIPPYSFGSYVPSNDWTLWSQVPLE